MAYVANTAFEVLNSNSRFNQEQNVAGKFGTGTGSGFTATDCSSGTLCVRNGLIPSEGYESVGILNGNTHYFNVATNGTSGGMYGDRTGIYAMNTYNVNSVSSNGQVWNIGANTLGIGCPAGERTDFTEIMIGERYGFGAGNFSTAPGTGVTTGYATIANGFLVFSSSAPATGTGVYFVLERAKRFTEGAYDAGIEYVCKAMRTAEAEPEAPEE